jgi:guanosine-3',5'-bis(diphosphate) 3'-pyrophosphohydrolase
MSEDEKKRLFNALLEKVSVYNKKADLNFIEKALDFAYNAHNGQKRASGEDYFVHCYEIAHILADLRLDSHTIAAGLLHDAIEDTSTKAETLEKEFDKETLELVLAVTKLKQIDKKVPLTELEENRAENIRKIMLATAKDVRVIIVKLVDRLHNMRTLKYLPEEKRKIIAKETMDIYAPIAHKLGMYNIKAELEDLSFRYTEPKIYQEFKRSISAKREEREIEVNRVIKEVNGELNKNHIKADVYGRAKHFYSIYKKIKKENKELNEIYDLTAIRIITDSVKDCYGALGIVHRLWRPMPRRFKDYIAVPKSNGYQSLHTTVVGSHGRILEVQIRTHSMHLAAEEGIASHWRYKGEDPDKKFDRQIEWLKEILDWKRTSEDANEFIEDLKVDLFQKEIFVFTPKGDPISLPEGATPVDFAYAVHTAVGNKCSQARVNGNIVPLDYKLSSGDIIEVITAKNAEPSRSWLSFAKSSNTKVKIKHALHIATDHKPKKQFKKLEAEKKKAKEKLLDIKEGNITVNGKKYGLKIPKCCNPKFTDKIRAFKTKDGKVVIHKADCINVYAYDYSKEINLEVEEPVENKFTTLRVDVNDRVGILAEVMNTLSHEGYNINRVNSRFGKDGRVILSLDIQENNKKTLSDIIKKIKKINSVLDCLVEE